MSGLGTNWTERTPASNNYWMSVTYGNGLFVAVSIDGNGDDVMTSPDGINWTSQTTPAGYTWYSVTYGNGLFVAISNSGEADNIMTSPDGINWTLRTATANNYWTSVTYGNGIFLAVSNTNVAISSDGINWTLQTLPANNYWSSVVYGNGLFVAVASSGSGNRVMTSPNGINWTLQTSAANNYWSSITYGNGLFVAIGSNGNGNDIMTSPDGINWTLRSPSSNLVWNSVTYGAGLFVAVAIFGPNDIIMKSSDGINWENQSVPAGSWASITYSQDMFVAVGGDGFSTGYVLTSSNTICVLADTNILMTDGSIKMIKDIKIGDKVLGDMETNKTNIVSRIITTNITNYSIIKIPQGLMDNSRDLFITEWHPVWCNNDKNRILAKNIEGTEKELIKSDIVYSLQFDVEGTFYANGLKVDSLSPYHQFYPLPKELFIDKSNYIEGIKILTEDDEIRNKPKMIKK